jgi:hypothetical protein
MPEASPLTGRVCRALDVVWWSGHTFYYTTARGCAVSWTFATVLGVAAFVLLAYGKRSYAVRDH